MKQQKRKICGITGTRAEYGLLEPLFEEIQKDDGLELQLIVTGSHLSPEFGYTKTEIGEQFTINKEIEIILSSDSGVGVSKSMGLAQISIAEAFHELQPDIIVVLGDRFEIFSAVASAMMLKIPVAHLSGGELTFGVVDDQIRHAITKMSQLHFVATEEYRNRVIQLGEHPDRVFNFGEAGLDNIKTLDLLSKEELEKSIGVQLKKKSILFTFHPNTFATKEENERDINVILSAIDTLDETTLIFTKANADEGGRIINKAIESYVSQHAEKAVCFDSLGRLRYLSALQYVDAVVGNSSSGIVEAPSFKIGTINIGDRQKGRAQASSTINTGINQEQIIESFDQLYRDSFQQKLKTVKNPYEGENASFKTKEILKNIELADLQQKTFYDIG
ncbi:MAG: UDP-N-acetylglucosamine 2-epimerase (hydrolyzing) [Flavobacteriales bacterium]|nr:UDP-N-acetylglucosamine 2-epimerase (hydrolyzing) [Flavobacteriales bacterium]